MTMKLVIVESPSKAKTIGKYLGQGYRVLASGGHICDLPEKRLGVDVENSFEPEYVVSEDKKRVLSNMKSTIKNCDAVYLATDPDREGEAISWHLANELSLPDDEIRIEFNEISKKAVQNALTKPRRINKNLVDAQQARRVLDRIVGYKISPVISKKIKKGLSAGRVQSAALRMVVDREREIRDFKPEEYWTLHAFFDGKKPFKAIFYDVDGKKFKIPNKAALDKLLAQIDGKDYVVDEVKRSVQKVMPMPPFTTSTLQQDATTKFSMSAPQVMQIAQQLYEGIELEGEGHVALVTYIRTDSVRVADDAVWAAKRHITEKYGAEYYPKYPNKFAVKEQAQDAHEAIRPISLDRDPESLKNKLQRNMYLVYKLIYDRFVASQMAPARYDTLKVHLNALGDSHKFGFKVQGRTMKFPGFTAAYADFRNHSNEDEGEEASLLPDLNEGDKLDFKELKYEQKFTKPPQRYTESTLIKAMEENGIGRPSTYASILSVIAKRAYTEKEGKSLKATELGETVCDAIVKYFPDIMDLKFTAKMEKELDEIEEGRKWQDLIGAFYPGFISEVKKAFYDSSAVKREEVVSDVKCSKCGAMMVVKEGRYGKFLACPNYPSCKNILSADNKVVGTCPICGKDVTEKHSKAGKVFYGCTGYPSCKFASWDIPAPHLCPKCKGTMIVKKGKGKTRYVCTSCKYEEEQ
ncbi:MAG: type I DNA topoisomerase [Clostridia bacterium]|nr:type I DNA topoisomerase [Clostridia bacterium]